MNSFTLPTFEVALRALLPTDFCGKLCVALSGGLDSIVLLHALAQLRVATGWRVRAIHVDHQLQTSSGEWAASCIRFGQQLDVAVSVVQVSVLRESSEGLEAAARLARYNALRELIQDKEVLFTAHHADDQLETILLALLRGGGAQGLAAMPACKAFGLGWHARPLLTFTRDQLALWANEYSLPIAEDPSNCDLRYDRNYLRHEVLPKLRARWPAAARSATRSAAHLAEANALLETLAKIDLDNCGSGPCLQIDELQLLDVPRRRNLLRYWLKNKGLRMPSQRKLAALEHDIFTAARDSSPCVMWEGAELHWYRGLLYADPARVLFQPQPLFWYWQDQCAQLPSASGALSMRSVQGVGIARVRLPKTLTIKFRSGGERIRLPGRGHRTELKKFLQERDVLPWWRERLPLIYADTELIAIADLAVSDQCIACAGEAAVELVWRDKPNFLAIKTLNAPT